MRAVRGGCGDGPAATPAGRHTRLLAFFAAGLFCLGGCFNLLPSTDAEGQSSRKTESRSARRHAKAKKKSHKEVDSEQSRMDADNRRVLEEGPSRLNSSLYRDMETWRAEAARQELLLQEYQLKRANDDEMYKEIIRRREEAYERVNRYEELVGVLDQGSPRTPRGGEAYRAYDDPAGFGGDPFRSQAPTQSLGVAPTEFMATGARPAGLSAPPRSYGGPSAAPLPAPGANDFAARPLDSGAPGAMPPQSYAPKDQLWMTAENDE